MDLAFRFAVEAMNAALEREADFGFRFADAREDNPGRITTSGEDAVELTARNNIEASAFARENRKDGQVRVGLYSKTDPMRNVRESIPIGVKTACNRVTRVHIGRRSVCAGQKLQVETFAGKTAVAITEITVLKHWERT